MHALLIPLAEGLVLTGELGQAIATFLSYHGHPRTAAHSGWVAAEARRVATWSGVDPNLAEQAGWLHDVSAVFPAPQRARIAGELGLDVLPEEEQFPMIAHQKLSVVLARELFQVRNQMVLDAIGCHTTLRAGATRLDKTLFVADKLAWDQPGTPPYHAPLLVALEESLDHAVRFFLYYIWERRHTLKVVHPWLRAAYEELPQLL